SAVVEFRAQVDGVTGLRVVDTGAFPAGPLGHPMSSTCECSQRSPSEFPSYVRSNIDERPDMFAEKIAKSILEGS
ncbi:uncharacterized protein BDZ99DRAFT_397098, partial [Mytilinidion resinicola]